MFSLRARLFRSCVIWCILLPAAAYSQEKQSSSTQHEKRPQAASDAGIEPGAVTDGVYRNRALGLSCKIPAGWVLRTEEMNVRDEGSGDTTTENPHFSQKQGEAGHPKENQVRPQRRTEDPRVLLAAFSRPPEARGEDVNGSILIAAESVATYPGLKEAAQYFGPLTEVAKAQGFAVDEEPYEFAVGARNVVRGDFHKDVGTRVMRQSTLAFLSHGYAISITVIGGTEDEVEELLDGVSFSAK